jgi:hypothetical protein
VRQGSNLGPIVFLVYVNDLPNYLRTATASMFADDTNLTASGDTIIDIQVKLSNYLEIYKCGCWPTGNHSIGIKLNI